MSTTTQERALPRTLVRSVPFKITRAEDDGPDGLTFEGYAAVWDVETEIDSWEGHFRETIKKGAFAKTLRETTPVLQFDHGTHPLIGSLPIGVIIEVREDEHGVYVKARLHADPLFGAVREAIASGAISGMSFRFEIVRYSVDDSGDGLPLYTLVELRCPELGPVVFPAYVETEASVRTRGVASIVGALDDTGVRAAVQAWLTEHPENDTKLPDPAPAVQATRDQGDPAPAVQATREQDDAPSRPAHPSQEERLRYLARVDEALTERT